MIFLVHKENRCNVTVVNTFEYYHIDYDRFGLLFKGRRQTNVGIIWIKIVNITNITIGINS